MRIISTTTNQDGREIRLTVLLASGETLILAVRRVSPWTCTISPNYEDMIDEVTADEYTELDSLTSAFRDILMGED